METSQIIQILTSVLSFIAFVISECMALNPNTDANGVLHWISMWIAANRDFVVSHPDPTHPDNINRVCLQRRNAVYVQSNTSVGDHDYYSQISQQTDVQRSDNETTTTTPVSKEGPSTP